MIGLHVFTVEILLHRHSAIEGGNSNNNNINAKIMVKKIKFEKKNILIGLVVNVTLICTKKKRNGKIYSEFVVSNNTFLHCQPLLYIQTNTINIIWLYTLLFLFTENVCTLITETSKNKFLLLFLLNLFYSFTNWNHPIYAGHFITVTIECMHI